MQELLKEFNSKYPVVAQPKSGFKYPLKPKTKDQIIQRGQAITELVKELNAELKDLKATMVKENEASGEREIVLMDDGTEVEPLIKTNKYMSTGAFCTVTLSEELTEVDPIDAHDALKKVKMGDKILDVVKVQIKELKNYLGDQKVADMRSFVRFKPSVSFKKSK